jgi:hypothetical protein
MSHHQKAAKRSFECVLRRKKKKNEVYKVISHMYFTFGYSTIMMICLKITNKKSVKWANKINSLTLSRHLLRRRDSYAFFLDETEF